MERLRAFIASLSPEERAEVAREAYAVRRQNDPQPPPLVRVEPPEYAAQRQGPNRSALAFWEKWSRNG